MFRSISREIAKEMISEIARDSEESRRLSACTHYYGERGEVGSLHCALSDGAVTFLIPTAGAIDKLIFQESLGAAAPRRGGKGKGKKFATLI